MKRPQEFDAAALVNANKQFVQQIGMAIKMLISPREAVQVLGAGGQTSKLISDATGTKIHLSGKYEYYPGTQMQEMCIKGPSYEAVCAAVMQILSKLAEETGRITGGEWDIEEGGARVHFVLPTMSAKAIIGRGGENIKSLRVTSGMKVHVEEIIIGAGELGEQVVSCSGPMPGLQVAAPYILEKVAEVAMQPWFTKWAFQIASREGLAAIQGTAPYSSPKGKGKASFEVSKGYAQAAYEPSYRPPQSFSAPPPAQMGIVSVQPDVDMLSAAVSAVPDALANPLDQSQAVQLSCPAACVSGVIGKAGAGVKEISGATGTKISIRDIPSNLLDKAIIISGNAVGVASAYLHVVSRIASVQEMLGAGITGLEEQLSGHVGDATLQAMLATGTGTQL